MKGKEREDKHQTSSSPDESTFGLAPQNGFDATPERYFKKATTKERNENGLGT